MEIFIDGGLFELAIAVGLGYAVNYIFKHKYLLVGYSVLIIAIPILDLFIKKGDWFYVLFFISMLNSILLIWLLWKQRPQSDQMQLLDTTRYKRLITDKFIKKQKRERRKNLRAQ
jgi:hypothetical protein